MRRRSLLTLAGTTLAAGLSGCASDDAPETTATDAPATTAARTPETTATDASQSIRTPTATDATASTATERPPTATEPATTPAPTPIAESWPSGPYADYETTRVRVLGPEGDERGAVTAAVADDPGERYLGLSDAESMPEDGGMLFVYRSVADRTFVMRRMDFGLDIVYADDAGRITTIQRAPAPGPDEDGNEQRYPGTGQYVLELNYGWTDRHGVGVGDRLVFEL